MPTILEKLEHLCTSVDKGTITQRDLRESLRHAYHMAKEDQEVAERKKKARAEYVENVSKRAETTKAPPRLYVGAASAKTPALAPPAAAASSKLNQKSAAPAAVTAAKKSTPAKRKPQEQPDAASSSSSDDEEEEEEEEEQDPTPVKRKKRTWTDDTDAGIIAARQAGHAFKDIAKHLRATLKLDNDFSARVVRDRYAALLKREAKHTVIKPKVEASDAEAEEEEEEDDAKSADENSE